MALKKLDKRIFLSAPHMSGDEEEKINEAFRSNWIAPLGPHVDNFEKEMAQYVGVKSALAVSSGTDALHLSCESLDIKQGDLVLCSSFTFAASIGPFFHKGAEVAFIDSEPESWNISPKALKRALEYYASIDNLPKAVIIVDLYGQTCDMDKIFEICNKYNVSVVEDAAEALGSSYKGKKNGGFGVLSALSFNGNKIITTSGGGMLLSNDEEKISHARFLATQARDSALWYQHSMIGWNFRMSNVLAGIGRAQLSHIDERVEMKRKIFNDYIEGFKDIPGISFMPEPDWSHSNHWLSTIVLDKTIKKSPIEILNHLADLNVEGRPLWKPMHMQPVFENAKYWTAEDKDICKDLFEHGLCLPSGTSMSKENIDFVIEAVKEAIYA